MNTPGHTAGVSVETPAKINVRLKITGKRPDGYHDLVSIMIPVTLMDRVELEPRRDEGVHFRCTGRKVPGDEGNLAVRAARSFFREAGVHGGVRIHLHKEIPVAAGLGGGSSDAAAVLVGLDAMYPGRLSGEAIHRMAADLGADVPFFLSAVPATARGIGEILEPLVNWPRMWYVLVKPPIEVSTAWVYGELKIGLTTRENDCTFQLLRRKGFSFADLLENDLEGVTEGRFPVIRRIKKALMEAGANGALMTGSGPTVFGVFEDQALAESAGHLLVSRNMGDVFVVTNWTAHGDIDIERIAGVSSSGKTRAFGARIRRFESSHPSQAKDS